MMLGMAAARSTRAISVRRLQVGAYSLRNMAVAMATGAPTTMATAATSTVPTIEASTPYTGCLARVSKPEVVKNLRPIRW